MKLTNRHNLPAALVSALENDPYVARGYISVTSLIGPPRIFHLRKRHADEITEDAADRIWSLIGSNTHAILQRVKSDDITTELSVAAEVCGQLLTGTMDVWDRRRRVISDYKVTSVYSVLNGLKPEWESQLNAYAHLLRTVMREEPTGLEIVAILRDWSETAAERDRNYPQVQVAVLPVPLWSQEQAETYISNKMWEHLESETLPDDALPACTPDERWARPDTWAVMQEGRKSALRVLQTCRDAQEWIDEHVGRGKAALTIQHRVGQSVRCERYCSVQPFCSQYKYMRDFGDIPF